MSTGYFPLSTRSKIYLTDLLHGLITASHILHQHSILDAYGHISIRNPDNPSTFFLSRNLAPALLSTESDIVEYNIDDEVSPVNGENAPDGFKERSIHAEMLRKFKGVNAVVHAHSSAVLPFGVAGGVPLRPLIHMAGFLGSNETGVPVWDIADSYSTFGSDERRDLLVKDVKTGASLAAAFRPSTSAGFVVSKLKAALPAGIPGVGKGDVDPSEYPAHLVVLMRGHGFTTCAAGLEEVVYQAIYTVEAAKVQTQTLVLHDSYFGASLEGKVDVEGGGKIKGGKVKGEGGEIKYLSSREADDAAIMNKETMMRPWALWVREVEVNPLYRNEIKLEDEK